MPLLSSHPWGARTLATSLPLYPQHYNHRRSAQQNWGARWGCPKLTVPACGFLSSGCCLSGAGDWGSATASKNNAVSKAKSNMHLLNENRGWSGAGMG
jgi:hypothetical protein